MICWKKEDSIFWSKSIPLIVDQQQVIQVQMRKYQVPGYLTQEKKQ